MTGGKANNFDDANGVQAMELFPADRSEVFNAKPWLGKRVTITGTLNRPQAASEAATELYVNVASLRTAP